MAGAYTQKKRSDMRVNVPHRRRRDSQRVQQQQQGEILEWMQWLVPVFGVAAAAAIAVYTKYLKDGRGRAIPVKNSEKKAFRSNIKLVDLSLAAKNGTLIKSRSAFV